MEAYKHSCPFCGQHIEYTEGYCGQQMACPICGKTVTFPAIPPGGRRSTLRLKRDAGPQREKWSFDLKKIWAALCNFEHWHIVRLSLVPFAIVAGLLVLANFVKKNFENEAPAPAPVPVHTAPANATPTSPPAHPGTNVVYAQRSS